MAGIESLQLKICSEKAIQTAMSQILPLKYFATSFSEAESNIGTAIRVPVFNVGDPADFDPDNNNYAGTTRGVTGVDVPLNKHIVKSIFYADRDFAECAVNFWEGTGEAIGRVLGKAIVTDCLSKINTTSVTQTAVFGTTEAGSKDAIANLYAVADENNLTPSECNVLVTPAIYAKILAQLDANVFGTDRAIQGGVIEQLYGFNSFACCPQLAAGLTGAIVHKEALGIASRLMPVDASAYSEVGRVTDEKSGFAIQFRRFAVPETGRRHISGEAYFGSALLQKDACVTLTASEPTP